VNLRDSEAEARFRHEVRSWLSAHLPPGWGTPGFREPETASEKVEFAKRWQRALFDGGWAGLDWPRAFGGRGAGVVEHLIWQEEYARARGPDLINLAVGLGLVGPTLIAHGTAHQKERYLQPILRGDEIWCQGFSEPNAGSDLASLRTRAERRGDEFIVSGQKIWTSFARYAQWCILVVRTNPNVPKHRGLTFLLVDMKSPGITIRPLREMTGEAWFNEVFFDEVRVPVDNVVGEVDRGWDVVLTTLSHERGSTSPHARLAGELERLAKLARATPRPAGRAADDPLLRQRLAQHAIEIEILRITAWRNASAIAKNGAPGPEGSILKVFWSELDQRLNETALDFLGPAGMVPRGDPRAVDGGFWSHELLWSRAATIYAGTSEIQRNIIAQRALGLPRS
jgi:alkylation response protein AidB-like acyl-CoA dehydrogenase